VKAQEEATRGSGEVGWVRGITFKKNDHVCRLKGKTRKRGGKNTLGGFFVN